MNHLLHFVGLRIHLTHHVEQMNIMQRISAGLMVTPWVGLGTNHQMQNLGIHSWKEPIWGTRVIRIGIWVKSISNLSICALPRRDQSGPHHLHIRNKCGKIQIRGQNWLSNPKGKKILVRLTLQNFDILTRFQNMNFPKSVNGKFRPNAHLHESIRNLNQQKPLPLQGACQPQAPSGLVLVNIQYSDLDCRPGNRENLRYSQAVLGPAIRSAVAYFADISGGAIKIRVLYIIYVL